MNGIGIDMPLTVANAVSFWSNWALVAALACGLLATYGIVVSANVKERFSDDQRRKADERIETLRNDNLKLEAKLAPRSLTQVQQNALTEQLKGLPKQSGTIQASPSLPESEWLARVLGAPLKAAGWDVTILDGTPSATVLQPTGVVIQYGFDPSKPLANPPEGNGAAAVLAKALRGLGIDAYATPMIGVPNSIAIVITPK